MSVKDINQIIGIIEQTVKEALLQYKVKYDDIETIVDVNSPDVKSLTVRINKIDILRNAFVTIPELIDYIHSKLQEDKLKGVGEIIISYEKDITAIESTQHSGSTNAFHNPTNTKIDLELSFFIV